MNRKLLAGLLVLILVPCLYAKTNRHGGRGKTATGGLNITAVALPDGTVGVPYSQTLAATGGTAPYTWAITGCAAATGCLPPPLTLGAGTGTISGTPTAAGLYSFTATVTDSAAHTYSMALGLTIASAGGATLFSDGFESGNLAAWGFVYPGSPSEVVSTAVKHTGTYALQDHFTICGDSTNPACGASHQDSNKYLVKYFRPTNGFASGLDHFFLRGYVYFKLPEPGATTNYVQRKLTFLSGHTAFAGSSVYDLVLTTDPVPSGPQTSIVLRFSGNWNSTTTGITPYSLYVPGALTFDAWHCIEQEYQLDTGNTANGIWRLWVDGVQVYSATNLKFRGLLSTTPIDSVDVGFQADRTNYDVVDEYRYWDDIVISTSYIGP